MKLPDFQGAEPDAGWFRRLLQALRKGLTFDDNFDSVFLTVNIGTAETEVGHPLGRAPRYVIEVAAYPNGTAGISFTREPTIQKLWLTRATAGQCTLLLM